MVEVDLVIVGTGFASSFFLSAYLRQARPDARVLVLERGNLDDHGWQIQNSRNSSLPADAMFVNSATGKRWVFTPAFGGGTVVPWMWEFVGSTGPISERSTGSVRTSSSTMSGTASTPRWA